MLAGEPERAAEEKRPSTPGRQLRGKLAQLITLDGFEQNTPFKEAMGFLAERYDIPIVFSLELAKVDKEFENRPIATRKLVGVRLRTIFADLLEQVEADMIQRDGVVLIVPRGQAGADVLLRQRVELNLDKRPLDAALEELVDSTGVNIVIDPRVAEKVKIPLTASLRNVPLETAVRILADMADLKPVLMDNVLYVTSRANAAVLQAEEAQRDKAPPVMSRTKKTDDEEK
jgi:hypothetical protein